MQVLGAVSSLNWGVSYEAAVCEHHSHHFHFSFFQKNVNQKNTFTFFQNSAAKSGESGGVSAHHHNVSQKSPRARPEPRKTAPKIRPPRQIRHPRCRH